MPIVNRRITLAMAFASLLQGGCWHPVVKPWDRDLLADPRMNPAEPALERAAEAKITFSREAARGGHPLGGGGCGCN